MSFSHCMTFDGPLKPSHIVFFHFHFLLVTCIQENFRRRSDQNLGEIHNLIYDSSKIIWVLWCRDGKCKLQTKRTVRKLLL